MATSTTMLPWNFQCPASTTLYPSSQPLKFHPKIQSLDSFRAQNIKIHCCQQQTLGNETQQKKKKRKPRPSFLEQVHNKWSLKSPSLREHFPWDKQLQEEEEGDEEQESSVNNKKFEKDSEVTSSVGVQVSCDVKVKSILAPWVHGNDERRKKLSNFEGLGEKLQGTGEQSESQSPREGFMSSFDLDGKIEDERNKFDDVDDAPIGLSEEDEIFGDDENGDATYVEGSLGVSVESFANVDDLARLPWERRSKENVLREDKLKNRNTELAERLIPEPELRRLRNVSLRMVERMKVGAAGVTQELVDAIHEKWKVDEVVKIKFEGPPSMNMRRTHEMLESRTGGLVIWRSGSLVVLYRGMTYKLNCVKSYSEQVETDTGALGPSRNLLKDSLKVKRLNGAAEAKGMCNSRYVKSLSEEEQMDLGELNLVLDELGPRFMDWSGRDPIPVDADLLPPVVPGYKPPFRLLPYGTKQALGNKEMTYLRRTARTLPPHFALGRNRELQGLALAIVNLWKKSAIAKIAIKRGVQNTSNERMAEELKILTGGTLLSRNKEFIVFYRGNDFLPPGVSSALVEAEKSTALRQNEEEQARLRAATLIDPKAKPVKQQLVAGTLAETLAATSRWGNQPNSAEVEKMMKDTAVAQHTTLLYSLQRKLALAKGKMGKAEKALQKVLENQEPEDLPTDLETLSDEERFLFRRIGLSMKPYLLLGRREIFGGTIENMHLHWKYRELVKVIVDRKNLAQVRHIAVSLEAESGGVLVSVDKTTKGYAIIVYRGKNYQRPDAFRPKNLLTKRQALARSIELQRREALKHHIAELEEKINKLNLELEDMKATNNNGAVTLDQRINAASTEINDKD